MWVALSDSTPLNGCMYIIPACFDEHYYVTNGAHEEEGEQDNDFDIQNVRAVPVSATTPIFWSGRLLHFGGRASRRVPLADKRISISFGYSTEAFEPSRIRVAASSTATSSSSVPSFRDRVQAIAVQLWTYEHREPLSKWLLCLLNELEVMLGGSD